MSPALNPNAPEFTPTPPGVFPDPGAPLPFSFSPPSSATFHHPPPPPYFPAHFLTYIPQQHPPPVYPTQATFYRAQPQKPTPPHSAGAWPKPDAVVHARVSERRVEGRGPGRGRGFRAGRGRGRNNEPWTVEGQGKGRRPLDLRDEGIRFSSKTRNSNINDGLGRTEEIRDRHRVMPLRHGDEDKTTVMIKNIPYHCSRDELISILDGFCMKENEKAWAHGEEVGADDVSAYDVLYLPIDFRTKKSRGFAFVNFTNANAVWKFVKAFHLQSWDSVEWSKWPKKLEIVCAKIQGKEALVKHFSDSIFDCHTNYFLPVCFQPARDGSGQPCQLTVVGRLDNGERIRGAGRQSREARRQ